MDNIFPYPLPETLKIGDVDPLDYRCKDGKIIIDPEWWRNIEAPPKKSKKKKRK